MKKIASTSVALAFALTAATSVMAQPVFFTGVGAGSSKLSVDYTDTNSSLNGSKSETDLLLSLRAGGWIYNDLRAYGTFSAINYDTIDQITVSGSVDQLFPINCQTSFYLGGTLGYTNFDLDNASNESGLLYGVQAGAYYQANYHIGIDLGLAYSMTTASYEKTYVINGMSHDFKADYDDQLVFRLGIDFTF